MMITITESLSMARGIMGGGGGGTQIVCVINIF